MTKTPALSPLISDILKAFFTNYRCNGSDSVRAHVAAVRTDLESHLEAEGSRVLTTVQQQILNTERQFAPDGAFVRTMHADDLYYALLHYLHPAHALAGVEQHEAQLDAVGALAEWLSRSGLIGGQNVSECTIIEFDLAMSRVREVVNAERAATRAERTG
jgi:hypothetical protein